MPRTPRPWFRFYVEALHDRKLRRLAPAHRWLWVAVLACARASAEPGWLLVGDDPADVDDLADLANLSAAEVRRGMVQLEAAGLVERDDTAWVVPKWWARQFESDTSAERTRRWRHRDSRSDGRSDVTETPEVTPPENRDREQTVINPPTTSTGAVDKPEDDEVIARALDLVAERRLRDANGTIRNPQAWTATVRRQLATDPGITDRAADLAGRYTLTPAQLADALDGRDTILRTAPRRHP